MAQDSILLDKSLHFAARIVKLYRYLLKEKHEAIISKQLIRSASSIGANANEAIYGNTKADFIAKLHPILRHSERSEESVPPSHVIPSKARNPFPHPPSFRAQRGIRTPLPSFRAKRGIRSSHPP